MALFDDLFTMEHPFLKALTEEPTTIPKRDLVFRCFHYFKPIDTKVIIIGQDPYPNSEDACGLAFSVEHNNYPPSLMNIFKELRNDLGYDLPKTGNLEAWAKQGVLLINTILTTERGKSLAHEALGWENLTKNMINKILSKNHPVVIIAWGKYAQYQLTDLELHDKVLILKGAHPSPRSADRGFFGGKYFSKANEWLLKHGVNTINWKL